MLCATLTSINAQEKDAVANTLTVQLDGIRQQGYINGFSVAIVNQNGIRYTRGFGSADLKEDRKYTENTVQNIGSISKTFIGVALLKAQELGKLNLDDPINAYLPFKVTNPYFPESTISIRQLATHTSSLKDPSVYEKRGYILKEPNQPGTKASSNFRPPEDMVPMEVFLKSIFSREGKWYKKNNFLKEKPGAIFEYSNLGAGLAAYIVQVATETPFQEFTTEHILEPLGMTASGWRFADIDFSEHSNLYSNTETQLPFYSLVNYADGGLILSAVDMGKYLSELIKGQNGNGKILTTASYEELFTPQLAADNFKERNESALSDEYNSGIFMGFSAKGYIGHTGSDPGVATFMFFNPKTQIGKILMVNTDLGRDGIQEFIAVWKTLEEYESKLD